MNGRIFEHSNIFLDNVIAIGKTVKYSRIYIYKLVRVYRHFKGIYLYIYVILSYASRKLYVCLYLMYIRMVETLVNIYMRQLRRR